jgi:hypothetical protein
MKFALLKLVSAGYSMQISTNQLLLYVALYLLFILCILSVMWIFAVLLSSSCSGWHKLAKRFRKQSEPLGETRKAGPFFFGAYGRFWTDYSSVIQMTAADDALYLSVLFLFRIGHPPLRIPWKEIKIGRTRFMWRPYVVLTLGDQQRIPLRISERIAAKLGILERLPN